MASTWKLTAAPAVRCKVKGGRKVVDAYEYVHRAWRAGVLEDFYLGTRSDDDDTVVWRLEGRELERADVGAVLALVDHACASAGVTDLVWGAMWCGYRELVVSFVDGSCVVQSYDGLAVVESVTPALVAVA